MLKTVSAPIAKHSWHLYRAFSGWGWGGRIRIGGGIRIGIGVGIGICLATKSTDITAKDILIDYANHLARP